jgi:hypothetical protein
VALGVRWVERQRGGGQSCMVARFQLTEEEHIALSNAGTDFCRKLALLTAAVIAQFPPDLEDTVVMYLQDQTSLYSPFTADLTHVEVQRLRGKK